MGYFSNKINELTVYYQTGGSLPFFSFKKLTFLGFLVVLGFFWETSSGFAAKPSQVRTQTDAKLSTRPTTAFHQHKLLRRGSFGGGIGMVAPSLKSLSMRMSLGARVSILVSPSIQISAFYFSSSESIAGSIQSSLDRVGFATHYVIRNGFLAGTYLGVGAGPAFLSDTLPPALNQLDFGGNATRFFMGPEVGFDYLIASILSVGIEGSYHFVLGPKPFQAPQALVSFKYRFGSKI